MSKKNDISENELQDDELFDQAAADADLTDGSELSEEEETAIEDSAEEQEDEQEEGHKSLLGALTNDNDVSAGSLKDLIRNMEFNGEWFRRNLGFIALITVCMLLFVTNRYQAQQEMIEEARLKNELADMKYIWLTRFSELTTSMRQSQIENKLKQQGDSTLSHSKQAPIIIRVAE